MGSKVNKVLRLPSDPPGGLQFGAQQLMVLQTVLAAAAPEEGCALLLGQVLEDHWLVSLVWPCLNAWQPAEERLRRFALDPREQLLAQKWARLRGWQVHGAAHSHPQGSPVPSTTDRAMAVTPSLMVIGDGRRPSRGDDAEGLQAWWLGENPGQDPIRVPLLMAKGPSLPGDG
jgi:proteasome lid subunit RPN8/RPN11